MSSEWHNGYVAGYRASLEAMKQELADFYAKRGDGGPLDPEDGYPWALSNMRGALMSIWDRELPPGEDTFPEASWVSKSIGPTGGKITSKST